MVSAISSHTLPYGYGGPAVAAQRPHLTPWRIHELAPDFHVEDVWALPTPGERDDFPALVRGATALEPSESSSPAVRGLFALRWKLGEIFGWDDEDAGSGRGCRASATGCRPTCAERRRRRAPHFPSSPSTCSMTSMRRRSRTGPCTASCTSAGSRRPDGGYRGQMAVLVKRNGLFGAAYMGAIAPFRHLIVYPTMIREIEREWPSRLAQLRSAG